MAEEEGVLTNLDNTGPQPNGEDTSPAVGIITQYVKDLSVENPAAPDVFQWPEPPQISGCKNVSLLLNKTRFSTAGRRFGAYYGYGT